MRIFQKIYDIVHVHVCYNNYYYVIEDFIEDFHFDIITLDTASLVLNHSHGHPTYHIPAKSVMRHMIINFTTSPRQGIRSQI